ncbi:MAG: hypothetical protein AB1716_21195 [Planctomycetota bacterium]
MLRIVTTCLSALFALALLVSLHWTITFTYEGGLSDFQVGRGAFSWSRFLTGSVFFRSPGWSIESDGFDASRLAEWSEIGQESVVVPLWIPLALVGVPTVWCWWRPNRRPCAPGCRACGYDLTGNVSGRCPECGCATESLEKEECQMGP